MKEKDTSFFKAIEKFKKEDQDLIIKLREKWLNQITQMFFLLSLYYLIVFITVFANIGSLVKVTLPSSDMFLITISILIMIFLPGAVFLFLSLERKKDFKELIKFLEKRNKIRKRKKS